MPPSNTTRALCFATQQRLEDILGRNDPRVKKTHTLGFTNALKSPQNTSGFQAIQVNTGVGGMPSNEDCRTVSIYYRPPDCNYDIQAGEAPPCKINEPSNMTREAPFVNVANYHHTVYSLSREQSVCVCDGRDEEFAIRTLDAVYQLKKAENSFFIEAYLSNYLNGCAYYNGDSANPGSGTEQVLKLFNDTGQPNAMSLFKLRQEYNRKGYLAEAPILVGGTGLAAWGMASSIFTGNVDGFDINRIPFNMPTFVDYDYDSIIGGNSSRLASWIPGHMQVLHWNKYNNPKVAVSQDHITKTVLEIEGELWDYTVYDDGCNDEILITIGRGYDLWGPSVSNGFQVFNDGSNPCDQGYCSYSNWILDCADLDCTDTIHAGEPIAP